MDQLNSDSPRPIFRVPWACPKIAECIATIVRMVTTLITSSDLYIYCGNDSSVSAFLSHFLVIIHLSMYENIAIWKLYESV